MNSVYFLNSVNHWLKQIYTSRNISKVHMFGSDIGLNIFWEILEKKKLETKNWFSK